MTSPPDEKDFILVQNYPRFNALMQSGHLNLLFFRIQMLNSTKLFLKFGIGSSVSPWRLLRGCFYPSKLALIFSAARSSSSTLSEEFPLDKILASSATIEHYIDPLGRQSPLFCHRTDLTN